MSIHPTAVVHPGAAAGPAASVGPFAVIGEGVVLGEGVTVGSHAVLEGPSVVGARSTIGSHAWVGPHVELGEDVELGPFVVAGQAPQHLAWAGEPTRLVVGPRTRVREFATLHRGTVEGGGVTRIGAGCFIMAYAHVAHDCLLGDGVILANGVQLGGHVRVGDHAFLGGLAAVHQHARIGDQAMLGGQAGVSQDVPPFMTVAGPRAVLHGLNLVGLRRRGITRESVSALKEAYRLIFRSGLPLEDAVARVRTEVPRAPEVDRLVEFLTSSKRGFVRDRA